MSKIQQTATHPSGKVLRIGDEVSIFGFKGEFVGVYKGSIMIYSDDSKSVESTRNWKYIHVPKANDIKTDIAGQLFKMEVS